MKTLNNNFNFSKLLFLVLGFVIGFLTLVISSFEIPILTVLNFQINTVQEIILLVLTEEIIRFWGLVFAYSKNFKIRLSDIFNAIFFGAGFSLFEYLLIYLNTKSFIFSAEISLFAILSLLSIIILMSVFFWRENRLVSVLFFFLLLFFSHLLYKLLIHIYIS